MPIPEPNKRPLTFDASIAFPPREASLGAETINIFCTSLLKVRDGFPWLPQALDTCTPRIVAAIHSTGAHSPEAIASVLSSHSLVVPENDGDCSRAKASSLRLWQQVVNAACSTPSLEPLCDRLWEELRHTIEKVLDSRPALETIRSRYRGAGDQLLQLANTSRAPLNVQLAFEQTAKELRDASVEHSYAKQIGALKRVLTALTRTPKMSGRRSAKEESDASTIREQARDIVHQLLSATLTELDEELKLRLAHEVEPYDCERFYIRLNEVRRTLAQWSGPTHSLQGLQHDIGLFRRDRRPIYSPCTKALLHELEVATDVYRAFFPPDSRLDTGIA